MKSRIISSILLVTVTMAAIIFGQDVGLACLIAIIGWAAQWEFYKMQEKFGLAPMKILGMLCGLYIMGTSLLSPQGQSLYDIPFKTLLISTIVVISATVLSASLTPFKTSIQSTLFGIITIPFMCSFPIVIRHFFAVKYSYIILILWMVIVTKACDIGGMFVGKYFGRRKISPDLSPQKTWEGYWGGIAASILSGVVLWILLAKWLPYLRGIYIILFSGTLGAISLLGDLAESALKRLGGIKDSGHLLPGIGGAFDFVDSLLLSLPLGIFLYATFLF